MPWCGRVLIRGRLPALVVSTSGGRRWWLGITLGTFVDNNHTPYTRFLTVNKLTGWRHLKVEGRDDSSCGNTWLRYYRAEIFKLVLNIMVVYKMLMASQLAVLKPLLSVLYKNSSGKANWRRMILPNLKPATLYFQRDEIIRCLCAKKIMALKWASFLRVIDVDSGVVHDTG